MRVTKYNLASIEAPRIIVNKKKMTVEETCKFQTLYERMGGDESVALATTNFFDEMVEDNMIGKFFVNVPMNTLKIHQVKLFRAIYGPDEERPDHHEYMDFILLTHSRLIRDFGLNETHFDVVIKCFVEALETLGIEKAVSEECVEILTPLREVFEYGADIAAQNKGMRPDELALLPVASSRTMRSGTRTVLPDYTSIANPKSLKTVLGKLSRESDARAWTCELTEHFGPDHDESIADTFLGMSFMNHRIYCAAILQLAFLPEDEVDKSSLIQIIKYPLGRGRALLSKAVWKQMIHQFTKVCWEFEVCQQDASRAVTKLHELDQHFPERKARLMGGIESPHVLTRVTDLQIDGLNDLSDEPCSVLHKYDESTHDSSSVGSSSAKSTHTVKSAGTAGTKSTKSTKTQTRTQEKVRSSKKLDSKKKSPKKSWFLFGPKASK